MPCNAAIFGSPECSSWLSYSGVMRYACIGASSNHSLEVGTATSYPLSARDSISKQPDSATNTNRFAGSGFNSYKPTLPYIPGFYFS